MVILRIFNESWGEQSAEVRQFFEVLFLACSKICSLTIFIVMKNKKNIKVQTPQIVSELDQFLKVNDEQLATVKNFEYWHMSEFFEIISLLNNERIRTLHTYHIIHICFYN